MAPLGIHTLEPAEYLGPQPGWNGPLGLVSFNDAKIGVVPFYLLAFSVPAAGAAIAGAAVAGPKRRVRGSLIAALGGGIGGLTATILLKALSE